MAVTFIGAGTLAGNATVATQAISSHASTQVGDFLIAQIINKSATANVVTPPAPTAGNPGAWTAVIATEVNDCTTAAHDHQYSLFIKRATVAGAQSYTFTKATDDNVLFAGVISAWRGAHSITPLDATAAVRTETVGGADNVTFPAYDPVGTNVHVIFMAYYGLSATTFAAAMSADTNPDCTTRYDLESATGTACSLSCTSGDNDGANVASRTWASASTTDAGNTGVVFALVAQEAGGPGDKTERSALFPARAVSRVAAIAAQPLGRSAVLPTEAEYVLPSPQEMWMRAIDSRVAIGTHLRSGTTALLIPAPEVEEVVFGSPVEQWMRPVDRRVAIIAQPLGYLPGEVAAPIRPLDWPVLRAPARAQTWVNDNRLILVGEDVLPHGPFDWPNPYIIRSAVSLRTWINDNRLLLVGQDQLPGRQPDWPVPRGAIAHPDLYAWSNRLTTGAFLSPFAQLDWPVPKGREFPRSLLTWTAKGQIEVEVFPFRETEWPNPLSPVWAERGWIVQTKLNLIGEDQLPHGPFDWPNPRGPTYPVSLRTWTEIFRLHGQDQFFGLAGHPNFDWPVPRGASRRPQDWQQGFRVVDQEAQFPPAGSIYDWPNPRGATYPVSLRTWTDQVRKQLIGQDALPHRQRDWPVPRGAARRPAQHSWVQRALAFAVAPVRPVDWPNPRAAAYPVSLRTWIDQAKGLLAPAAQLTLQPKDWPNPIRPRSAAYLVEYPPGSFYEQAEPFRPRDWPNPRGRASLAYQVEYTTSPSIIVLPSSGGRGDWPNPLGPVYPVSLRTWSERFRLHGQDKFFGLAGHPNYDWPVPKGPKGSVSRYTHIALPQLPASPSNQLVQIVIIGD